VLSKLEITFPLDHPTGPGHFPGNTIIPGAVLLAEVLRLMADNPGLKLPPYHIKSAKFSHPTRPGDCIAIKFSAGTGNDIKFLCTVGNNIVLTGIVKCDAPAIAP
jgi:3-hydroxymyristoyl/3-hydroxydecanoyl-(acyl carrier protein) dehydratase